jgi:excisionase family DNA binding protein
MLALEDHTMRTWLRKQIAELTDLRAHPEPDQALFELCAAVVREAADRAAKVGMLDHYDQHKNMRFCTPRDAVAVLSSILAALPRVGAHAQKPSDAAMTVAEASEHYGIPERTIYALCKAGQLAHLRVGTGRGTIRIKPADLDRHLQQNRVETRSADSVEDLIFGSPD